MAESTFFANRAIAKVVTGETKAEENAVFTNGSDTITYFDSPLVVVSPGDYIYNHDDDTQFNLSRVKSYNDLADTVTLEYNYDGTGGSLKDAYIADISTISVLKGVEITTNWEIETLYGFDSIQRQDEAKHSIENEIKISFAKFDPEETTDWGMTILKPAGGDGTISDVNDVYVPYMIITIEDTDAVITEILLSEVYFENFPTNLSENDFVVRELTGHAKNIKFRSY